jgi:2-phosphosulfolactate phosphatase
MVDVAFTRAEARPARVTVVIDVLRATSTIVQALESGYARVLCADGLDGARQLAAPGRVLAGERHCVRPAGFDLGNSPAETDPPRGDELVLATTNGAPAIVRAAELSDVVLVACLLNLDAVIATAAAEDEVQLLCSGTDGRPALEDTYVAGRIVERLDSELSDSALVARSVARDYLNGRGALAAGADAQVLNAAGLCADIDWCARESVVSFVPRLTASSAGVAVVERVSTNRETAMSYAEHLDGRF